MPVEFIHVDVKKYTSVHHINFATSSEVNNDYFSVERSPNGRHFIEIGVLKSMAQSNELTDYFFTDDQPLVGLNYYRIKQVDYDGNYSYSPIKSIKNETANHVQIFPSINQGLMTVDTDWDDYFVAVYDEIGQMMVLQSGLSKSQSLNIESLMVGVYIIKITKIGYDQRTFKVIKY